AIFGLTRLLEEETEAMDINAASLRELQRLPGIGPVLAQRIVEARPFDDTRSFRDVKGIGSVKYTAIVGQNLIYVGKHEPTADDNSFTTSKCDTTYCEKIDLNVVSVAQLRRIAGVGPVLARLIVAARPFQHMQELLNVKGIGSTKYAALVRQNLAFVGKAKQMTDESPFTFSQSDANHDEKIELNGASASELQRLVRGVGQVLARRIEEAKPFHHADDLLDVRGIGAVKCAAILEQFYVDATTPVAFTCKMEPSQKGVATLNIKVDIAALRRRGGNLSVSLQLTT
ncbi:hypothetical protein BBJ28_00020911, partial [Nothophytophthora sp. Chile5]